MLKQILLVLIMFYTVNITFADCNYNFEINNTSSMKLTVSAERDYFVHIKGTSDVEANSSRIIHVVGNSGCGSHATDLILKITSGKNNDSNKLRIHQTEGDSNFFDVFLDGVKSASKINKKNFFENNKINVTPSGLSFGSIASSNWMSEISDNTDLSSLIMPGSHDAGMSVLSGCTFGTQGLTKTQYLDINGQLMSGSRYFDIRPSYSNSENAWITYHRTGKFGCNGQLILNYGGSVKEGDIMKQAYDFIKSHPKETVILDFSHPRFSDDVGANKLYDDLATFANAHPSILVTKDKSTMLDDLRGHIVLVLSDDIYDGIDPDKISKDEIIWKKDQLHICDNYTGTEDLEVMKRDQLEKLEKNGGLDKRGMFLLSWTLTPSSLKSVESLASKANAALPNAMNNDMTNKQPNIIFLDFIDEKITSEIIHFSSKYRK